QARQGLEARPRRVAELVPVREALLRAGPVAHHGQGGRVRDHHFRVGPLHHPLDFLGGEPPVDGIRDHALAGARRVQVDVGYVVLGENADTIASGVTQPPQPGRQRIRPLQQLPEGPLLCPLDQRGSIAVERGAPRHHVVDREGLGVHLDYWPTMSAFIGPRAPSNSLFSAGPTLLLSIALTRFSTVAFHSASVIFIPVWAVFMS